MEITAVATLPCNLFIPFENASRFDIGSQVKISLLMLLFRNGNGF
jgi:hypothetical protein